MSDEDEGFLDALSGTGEGVVNEIESLGDWGREGERVGDGIAAAAREAANLLEGDGVDSTTGAEE